MDLEEVWRIREEDIYPSLFGGEGKRIYALTPRLFERVFGRSEIDPTWLHYGVFEYAPTRARPFWLYVTSGNSVSQPDVLPAAFSLPSGRVDFMTFTGATDSEIGFAKEHGTSGLIDILRERGAFPVTDPARRSTI